MEGIVVDKNSLCFMIPKEGMISSEKVKVSNLSEEAIVFRVKTNDRYRFNVRPRNGIIQAQATLEIEIVFNGTTEDTSASPPRLRLDVAPLPSKAVGIEAKEFWRTRDAIFKRGESYTLGSYPLFKYYFNIKLIDFNQSNSFTKENITALKSIKGIKPEGFIKDYEHEVKGEDVVRVGRKTIRFPCSPRGTCSADDVLLENYSKEPVTFRVRSTDPKIFLAKPNNGIILANDSVDIACIYNGLNSTKKQRSFSHYFQVDVANSMPNNPSRFWAAFDMNLIHSIVYTLVFQVEFQKDEKKNAPQVPPESALDDSPSFFNISRSFKNLKLERMSRAQPPRTTNKDNNNSKRYNSIVNASQEKSLSRLSIKQAPRSKTTDLVRVPRQKQARTSISPHARPSDVKLIDDAAPARPNSTIYAEDRPWFGSRASKRDSNCQSQSRALLNFSARSKTSDLRYDTDVSPSHADVRRSMSVRLNDHPSSLGSGVGLHRTPNHHIIQYECEQVERKPSSTRKSSSKRIRRSIGDAWSNWRRR